MKNYIKYILGLFTYFFTIKRIKTQKQRYNTILVFAPHPDDEIIGLGGLILQTLKHGGEVFICFLTEGENSECYHDKNEIKKQREVLTNKVLQQLNIPKKNRFRLKLPDGQVPLRDNMEFDKAVSQITTITEKVKPDAVYATAESDFWPFDHVACSQLVKEAVKKITFKTDVWFYWVWTWYHLKPWQLLKLNFNKLYKMDISMELKEKEKLIDTYLKPVSPDGFPWSGRLPKSMKYPFSKPFEIIEKYER